MFDVFPDGFPPRGRQRVYPRVKEAFELVLSFFVSSLGLEGVKLPAFTLQAVALGLVSLDQGLSFVWTALLRGVGFAARADDLVLLQTRLRLSAPAP